jgi:GNAT superfamily N-acetyltransferase
MTVLLRAQRGIEPFDPTDRPLLEAFQHQYFGEDDLPSRADYQAWAYTGAGGEPPQFWVCRRNGAFVGQQCGIPFTLQAGEEALPASWAVDLMVAPEWRMRGVGPALSERHAEANPITVALGMTDAAFKTYRRAGWIDLGAVPTWLRPIDLQRCLAASPYNGPLLALMARVGQPALGAMARLWTAPARLAGASLIEVPVFDERVDALWEAARPHHPVLARRDRAFLAWRFDTLWASSGLSRLYVIRRGEVMAYAVLRVDPWKGVPVGVVLDVLARPGWMARGFALIVEHARQRGLTALACRIHGQRAARALGSLGFLSLKQGVRAPTRAMVRLAPSHARLAPLLGDPRNWHITAADSDGGFRPLGR